MEVFRRLKSPNWYVTLYHPKTGERLRKSLNYAGSKAEAQKRAARMLLELESTKPNSVTLGQAIEEYVGKMEDQRQQFAKDHRYRMPRLLELISPTLLVHEITPALLEKVVRGRLRDGKAPQTIRHDLSLLRAATIYAGSALGATMPPGMRERGFWRMPKATEKTRYLSPEEFRRLHDHLDPSSLPAGKQQQRQDVQDLVVALAYTGARWSEVAHLTWDRIDIPAGTITLYAGKVQKERVVAIPAPLQAVLRRRLGDRGMTPYVFPGPDGRVRTRPSDAIGDAMDAVGLNAPEMVRQYGTATVHSLRHTFASWLRQGGADLDEVADALGHSTMAMTKRYAHLGKGETRAKLGSILNSVTGPNLDPIQPLRVSRPVDSL